jgi:ribose/xylose/arabinose/galactoside ABC-type transport system permease subunit
MRVTHIGPLSVAKVAFILYGGIGLIVGAIVALASLLGATIGMAQGEHSALIGAVFGVGAVVLLPLLYGGFGALGALISAGLYNLVAGMVGGVELTLEQAGPR